MAKSITLTEAEMRFAAYGGVERQLNAIGKRRGDQFRPRDYWGTHVLACMAELAVAKWRGRYWSPAYDRENLPGSSDVGAGEVRSSTNIDSPLILRPRDEKKGEAGFVLVVTEPPVMHLVGWAYGREVMAEEFWRPTPEPAAWFMPQDRLRTID